MVSHNNAERRNLAHFSSWLETQDSESSRDNDSLELVLSRRNTLEQFKSLQSGGTSSRLVGDHSSDSLVEDSRRGSEMERTSSGGVDKMLFCDISTCDKARVGGD